MSGASENARLIRDQALPPEMSEEMRLILSNNMPYDEKERYTYIRGVMYFNLKEALEKEENQ